MRTLGTLALGLVIGCSTRVVPSPDAPEPPDPPGCPPMPPACAAPTPVVPRAVCIVEDDVLVVADGRDDLSCTGTDGDATRFGSVVGCERGGTSRRVACCAPGTDPAIDQWVFEGAVLGTTVGVGTGPFEPADEYCRTFPDAVGTGPPVDWEPEVFCDDPLAWKGVPVVFSVSTPGADPCGGGVSHAESCEVTVIGGDRIVVELHIADAAGGSCPPGPSDDRVDCAIPPLAAGDYEIRQLFGRRLGSIHVAEAPLLPRAPRCAPIGGP